MSMNEEKKSGGWKDFWVQAVIIAAALVTIAAGLHSLFGGA